ncbi:MAG: hypothetical protein JW702_05340 [Clostridiales bacterium]|nr:hypothetical protein [Clostridiales bacterium]
MRNNIIVLIVILFLFSACKRVDNIENQNKADETINEAANELIEEENVDFEFKTEESLIDYVILVLNTQDSKKMLDLSQVMWPGYFSLDQMIAAMEDYKIMTKSKSLTEKYRIGLHPFNEKMVIYNLKTTSGESINFRIVENNGIYMVADFVMYYATFKNNLMDRYIEAIKNENIESLSSVIYHDEAGIIYPEEKTIALLYKYKEVFDIASLEWRFIGEFGENDEFIIEISGTKDDIDSIHKIEIVHSDGQVGIVDMWAPPK